MIIESILRRNLTRYFRIKELSGDSIAFNRQWDADCQTLHARHEDRSLKIALRFTAVPDFIVVYGKLESSMPTTLRLEYDAAQLGVCFCLGHKAAFPDGSEILPLQYNTMFFAQQRWTIDMEKDKNYEFVVIRFRTALLDDWPDNPPFVTFHRKVMHGLPAVLWGEHLVIMPRMLRLIRDLISPDRTLPHNALLHLRCTQLLVMMLEQVSREIETPMAILEGDTLQKVQIIRVFMLENISQKISRAMLLREVGTGPKKIQEGFHCIYGKSMFELLHEERMEHAWKWIRDGQRSISAISVDLGYKTQKHFSKVFKNYFGIKPSENKVFRRFPARP